MSDEKKVEIEYAPCLIGKRALIPHDEVMEHEYPDLWTCLMPKIDAKGRLTREPGVISIRIDGSLFRVTLVCPTEGVQVTVEMASITNVLSKLNATVTNPLSAWVPTFDSKKKARRDLDRVLNS